MTYNIGNAAWYVSIIELSANYPWQMFWTLYSLGQKQRYYIVC